MTKIFPSPRCQCIVKNYMHRVLIFIVSLFTLCGMATAVRAQEAPVDSLGFTPLFIDTPTVEPVADIIIPKEPPQLTVITAIERGRELLAPVLVDFKKKEPQVKPVPTINSQTAIGLAIWNKQENTVTVYGGTRGYRFFTADNGGWQIPKVSSSGAHTAFRDSDPNLVVVGTVQADMIPITYNKKKMYAPNFSYYVPYNSELYSPETLAAGSDYLSFLIQEAFDELDAKGITSRAFPGNALTAVIDSYLIKSIAVIEHADGQIYEDENSEDALGRFFVKLAINKEAALGSAVSSAGARGMVQFIPSTYEIMVTKRPDLELIPDFVEGMADHKNAVQAEVAYLDMILADLPQEIRDKYIIDRGSAASYIAAGYNGGSTRVKRAILNWGEDWSSSHGYNAYSLRNETIYYVVKLRRVYDMLAAGFFATPQTMALATSKLIIAMN